MGVHLGIDVGGSATKIVGFRENGDLLTPAFVRANDPLASVYGALGRFTAENALSLSDLDKITVTGVGASFLGSEIYGVPCERANEFSCVGRGGLYLSSLPRAVVVSMGTGTALVLADERESEPYRYLGGTGVGGGTVTGLARQLLGIETIDHLVSLAEKGDLAHIDLRVGDIVRPGGGDLPAEMTASNFGKLSDLASREDIARGILNLVLETIGMLAVFSARGAGGCPVVLTGRLSTIPQARDLVTTLREMFGIETVIPQNAEFATVIGAALGK